jgi:hypothetical protein
MPFNFLHKPVPENQTTYFNACYDDEYQRVILLKKDQNMFDSSNIIKFRFETKMDKFARILSFWSENVIAAAMFQGLDHHTFEEAFCLPEVHQTNSNF